jgi:tetratricopeptide (TPR) repeat protein
LLRIDSDQALVQTLHDHPILAEAEALFALAGLINEALTQQQNETVARLVLFLALLPAQYNHAHSEQIDLETHQAVIDLFDQVIPLAEQIDAGLAAMLRQQAGWACNTLGNHFAADGDDKDLGQAVAAYTRGLALDPANAMLLRNRAGVHLDRQDRTAAQADIEAAAALEPDAPRLADLRAALDQAGAA